MNSLNFIYLFGLFASAFSIHGTEKLNVVFILADDMSRDTWGAYGGKDCKTPTLTNSPKMAYALIVPIVPWPCALLSGRNFTAEDLPGERVLCLITLNQLQGPKV